jgi:hypothetical protein
MYFMLQITINASLRPVFYSGRYATGNIPTNHPCLTTFYGFPRFGGWHHFFKLAFPPLTLNSLENMFQKLRRLAGSTPLVGSSSKITLGDPKNAKQQLSFLLFSPLYSKHILSVYLFKFKIFFFRKLLNDVRLKL